MSQLPDETLRRILQQIQNTAQQSSRSLSLCRAQISQKERDRRVLQLTTGEIMAIPRTSGADDVKMYKGVGKMFMQIPRPIMEKDLKAQEKQLGEEIAALTKKSKFLEKQLAEAQSQLKDIFHHAERQGM
ncbi:hypothetical protein FRB99_005475 [Tulasnella sp. 403]|nr:hypothetical protein FRB99_005475 [Tulasnella sp. 403]